MNELSKESMDKMMYMLLKFKDEDAMLKTADILLTEKYELMYLGGELHQLGYESMMESGDRTPNHKVTVLFDFVDNKLASMEDEDTRILMTKSYNESVDKEAFTG